MARSNYAVQLARFAKKASDITDRVVRQVVLEIGTRIVDRSPVGKRELWAVNIDRAKRGLPPVPKGYIGGRFRANWQYGNDVGGGIPESPLPDIDGTGAVSVSRIAAALPVKAAGMKHVLINNLPYAQALEDGHSTQAPPSGIIGLTVLEFPQIVADVVASEKEA